MGVRLRAFSVAAIAALLIGDAGSQDSRFRDEVYPVLERAGCGACHNSEGVASATRLHFPEPGAPAEMIERFGLSLRELVDPLDPENSLLLRKPTNRTAHVGGKRILPGSSEELALSAWVRHLAGLAPGAALPVAPAVREGSEAPVLRRLTHSQYDNTVRDLLGDISAPAGRFPPEDFVDGFKNQRRAQGISPLQAEAYRAAAERLAAAAFRGGAPARIIPCRPESAHDPGCVSRFLKEFGLRAFRRPLTDAEVQRYAALLARGEDFLGGAQVVVEAMIQSPSFLFLDPGSDPAREPYARAARLSYFLWDTMPDDELLGKAAAGALDTREGLEREARRMIGSPKAQGALNEFIAQWLRFDLLLLQLKERRIFPQFNRELALAMAEETRRLVGELVWNDRNFMDLFTANYSFVNAELAGIYGLPAPPGEFARVGFPAGSERAGILGQGTFLVQTSKPAETSPTARGLFVREQFLCQKVPLPPPGTNMNLPPLTEDKPRTNRERLAIHLSNESCATCHNLIDPIGFGLETYDAIGARQEKFRVHFVRGEDSRGGPETLELDMDRQGWVEGLPDSGFESPRDLGAILASSRQCRECIVRQLFRYATGRKETPADAPVLDRAFEDFQSSQFRFKELMISVIKWVEFPPQGNRE